MPGKKRGTVIAGLGQQWRPWRALALQELGTPCHLLCPALPPLHQPGAGPSPQHIPHRLSISQPWDLLSLSGPASLLLPFSQPLLLLPSLESSTGTVHRLVPFPPSQTRVLHCQRGTAVRCPLHLSAGH